MTTLLAKISIIILNVVNLEGLVQNQADTRYPPGLDVDTHGVKESQ